MNYYQIVAFAQHLKKQKINNMNNEFQVLVFSEDNDILSSQHYDYEPTENEVNNLIYEDKGIRAEVYEVNGDDYSKHLITYEIQ